MKQVIIAGQWRITIERIAVQPTDDKKLQQAVDIITQQYNVTWDEIKSRNRTRKVATARQYLYLYLYRNGYSTYQIGTLLGRHHSTVKKYLNNLNTEVILNNVTY